ncbi:MbcA/ParS/Xre antitoxin family protein [sulfur-oxidizing endosymbiont of Gigantopelta aegis]|uniref:MbcA/ParS/Xre antitoxin family protein n=1 Tax=sulfur-oxidizing endosymbiont of Gigantopelta aegis TaxID=2794934 RepID=UPI0018DB8688
MYKSLHIIFSEPKQANSWIQRDNQASLFAGRSALDFMLQGNMINLFEVRKYLDAWRG